MLFVELMFSAIIVPPFVLQIEVPRMMFGMYTGGYAGQAQYHQPHGPHSASSWPHLNPNLFSSVLVFVTPLATALGTQ